jgi:serine/threonine-protein kinase
MQSFLKSYFKAVTYIITFIVLSLLTTFITLTILSYNKTVEVPDIQGMNVIKATKVLEKAGLLLKIVGQEHDQFIQPGYIVRQEKAPGTMVKNGRVIRIYLSKGPAVTSLPSYEGLSVSIVEKLLLRSGSRIRRKVFIHSDDVMRGRVVAHRPLPGEPGGETIDVIVSLGSGQAEYICPNFVKMSKKEAQQLAAILSIKLHIDGRGTTVQGQNPRPGTVIKKGSFVDITFEGVEEVTDRSFH